MLLHCLNHVLLLIFLCYNDFYCVQVEHILIVEELLMKFGCLKRWKKYLGTERSLTITLASEPISDQSLLENISFFLWGGEHYGTYQTLKSFL